VGARDESPNRRFLYAQSTTITVSNLLAVTIFIQKMKYRFPPLSIFLKKKKNKKKILTIFWKENGTREENGISF